MKQISVAAFTGGEFVPSARFRVRQYIPALLKSEILMQEVPCQHGKYPPASRMARLPWLFAVLAEQSRNVARTWAGADVVLLQREIVSKLVTFESLTRRPRILDVDDAIYLFRGGKVARRLARVVDVVICGNSTLADWFSQYCKDIVLLPTPVDTSVYVPKRRGFIESRPLVIGWIGTSSNLGELMAIEEALAQVLRELPNAVLMVVADKSPTFREISSDRVRFVRWSPDVEASVVQDMDIGLMPLRDTAWNRGKCSFKMIQYLACGVPAVVSPVGMNADVLAHGTVGIAARENQDWVDALLHLAHSPDVRERMGGAGRSVAERYFSLDMLTPVITRTINRVVGR